MGCVVEHGLEVDCEGGQRRGTVSCRSSGPGVLPTRVARRLGKCPRACGFVMRDGWLRDGTTYCVLTAPAGPVRRQSGSRKGDRFVEHIPFI